MKIAIIGANGKIGQLLEKEAVSRGYDVTAIVRKESLSFNSKTRMLIKDLFKLSYDNLKEFDVIIDAFGTWAPESLELHQTSLKYLANLLSNKPNRLLVVGGAGSLYVNKEHTIQVIDDPNFPDMVKPLASSMGKALDELRKRTDVQWTYISPAGDFQAEGERTGDYTLAGEELTLNSKGKSEISYGDYAIAMIDEAIKGNHIQERISVVSK